MQHGASAHRSVPSTQRRSRLGTPPHFARAHFFGVATKAMRHILVDHARSRQAAKRGGAAQRVTLDEAGVVSAKPAELIALDDALQSLAALDPRKSQIVEFKYFGGLTVEEVAEVLQVSPETIARDWRLARAWLLRELAKTPATDE
jgi:RNA polymerase sigma factor (TIGR02999 family)